MIALLQAIDHAPTRLATSAERAFLARVEGGCQAPVGALGTWSDDVLDLTGVVASADGRRLVRAAAGQSSGRTPMPRARALTSQTGCSATARVDILEEIRGRGASAAGPDAT